MKTSTTETLFKSRFNKQLLLLSGMLSPGNHMPGLRALIFFITLSMPGLAAAGGGHQTCQVISHSSFNIFNECRKSSSSTTLWVNVHTKLNKELTQNGDYLLFSGGTLYFNDISTSFGSSVSLPNGEIIADNSVNSPTSSFNTSSNTWITRVPLSYSSTDIFICGAAVTSSSGFRTSGYNKYTTLSGSFFSNEFL